MHLLPLDSIHVAPGRVRVEFDAKKAHELANDILAHGLFHPIVVDRSGYLLAGERRLRAIRSISALNRGFLCNAAEVPPGYVPVTFIHELTPIQRLEAEVAENAVRVDLSWQERAAATARLDELNKLRHGDELVAVPVGAAGAAATKTHIIPKHDIATAAEVRNQTTEETTYAQVYDTRQDLIVAAWFGDEDVAKAGSRKDALKIIEEKLEAEHRLALSREFKRSTLVSPHTLVHGDCLELFPQLPDGEFDVICTDPPYGMGLHTYADVQNGVVHHYDDTRETSDRIAQAIFIHGFRVTRAKAHLYMFCDIRRFFALAAAGEQLGWKVWPRPLIWYRSDSSGVLPLPERGPRYGYEAILFASKGDKRVLHVASDVLAYAGDREERSAARKPVPLLVDLLRRSALPGDYVLDPCAGSGPIIEAAHALELRSYAIEVDEAIHGLAAKRLEGITLSSAA